MVAIFTLIIVVFKDILYIRISAWNPVVGETSNCEREAGPLCHRLINSGYLRFIYAYVVGLRKYSTIVGHLPHVIPCICTLF